MISHDDREASVGKNRTDLMEISMPDREVCSPSFWTVLAFFSEVFQGAQCRQKQLHVSDPLEFRKRHSCLDMDAEGFWQESHCLELLPTLAVPTMPI
jgi:hypothetical protein